MRTEVVQILRIVKSPITLKNVKLLFFLILFFLLSPSYGQKDTLHFLYDANWKKVLNKNQAVYYGKATENEIGYWELSDYYLSGKIQMKGRFTDSTLKLKQGKFIWYFESGVIKTTASYYMNIPIGDYYTYYENGKLDAHIKFDNFGTIETSKYYKKDGSESVIIMPEFIGGEDNLYKFINQRLKYPRSARKKNIFGDVIVSFEVLTNGTLDNFKIMSSPNEILSDEALRVWCTPIVGQNS